MEHIEDEAVQRARQVDLLVYLQEYEPGELVHLGGDTYCTKTHDSLKISNGKWMWWSRGIGGHNALDYLIKVQGMSFAAAVEILSGKAISCTPPTPKPVQRKHLVLPEKNKTAAIVTEYLFRRGIDLEIIQTCLAKELLYESLPHHNVVFVGYDGTGTPRYAAYRAAADIRLMGDASGSDKRYAFRLESTVPCEEVHVFESAIDALSYATLLKLDCQNWQSCHLLSLAGVYAPGENRQNSKPPSALLTFLQSHPSVKTIHLHLDTDGPGRLAAKAIQAMLNPEYEVIDSPPSCGKDVNDQLCSRMHIRRHHERSHAR